MTPKLSQDLNAIAAALRAIGGRPAAYPAAWLARERTISELGRYTATTSSVHQLLDFLAAALADDIRLAPAWNVAVIVVAGKPDLQLWYVVEEHEREATEYFDVLLRRRGKPTIDRSRAPIGLVFALTLRYLESVKRASPEAEHAREVRGAIKAAAAPRQRGRPRQR